MQFKPPSATSSALWKLTGVNFGIKYEMPLPLAYLWLSSCSTVFPEGLEKPLPTTLSSWMLLVFRYSFSSLSFGSVDPVSSLACSILTRPSFFFWALEKQTSSVYPQMPAFTLSAYLWMVSIFALAFQLSNGHFQPGRARIPPQCWATPVWEYNPKQA